jgi:hypothetical protein
MGQYMHHILLENNPNTTSELYKVMQKICKLDKSYRKRVEEETSSIVPDY